MENEAIILCGGRGKRMGGDKPKQYMELDGYPLIYYTIAAFENSFIENMILVCTPGDEEYCRREIVERYGFLKVGKIVPGGRERYDSVMCGLRACSGRYIFIHDGARIFAEEDMLKRLAEDVREYGACVAAVPVKDTIKLADGDGFVEDTPDRSRLWQVQTPQVFEAETVRRAYAELEKLKDGASEKDINITDDAMVVERFLGKKVKLTTGSYENIKITTPEDLDLARVLLENRKKIKKLKKSC